MTESVHALIDSLQKFRHVDSIHAWVWHVDSHEKNTLNSFNYIVMWMCISLEISW